MGWWRGVVVTKLLYARPG